MLRFMCYDSCFVVLSLVDDVMRTLTYLNALTSVNVFDIDMYVSDIHLVPKSRSGDYYKYRPIKKPLTGYIMSYKSS